jgi:RecB family exonuclease
MMSLPMLEPRVEGQSSDLHRHHAVFATAEKPLRPSRLVQLTKCPMSVFMTAWNEEDEGGNAAQTGNLVHSAAAVYHKTTGTPTVRREAGLAALEAARSEFPQGDPEKGRDIFTRYAGDPENQNAVTPWVEERVKLVLAPHETDPTGQPIVIAGTLDQVRREKDGSLRVYDIKTGSGKTADESLAEYAIQQAAYVLAARQTLDPNIQPGSLIYTPGYEKPRGRRFLPLNLSVERCMLLLTPVVVNVAMIRRGIPVFTPSAGACQYCKIRPYNNCLNLYKGVYER